MSDYLTLLPRPRTYASRQTTMCKPNTIDMQEVGDLVREIDQNSPLRKLKSPCFPTLAKPTRVLAIPLKQWDKLCRLLRIEP